jgi:hypothetical protein
MHERNTLGEAWYLQFIATKSAIVESHLHAENDKRVIELYKRIFSYVVTGVSGNILLSSTLCPEDRGSRYLRNFCTHLPEYIAL